MQRAQMSLVRHVWRCSVCHAQVQWVQALRAAGFTFWVLPRAFLTHVPHTQTRAGREWSHNSGGHKQHMDELFDAQLEEARKLEEREEREARSAGTDVTLRREACTRTPACKVPLAQFIDPLDPSNAGRRAQAQILA